ncbi:MAG: 6-phosphogluconolactonase [Actinomycetes bacterium]
MNLSQRYDRSVEHLIAQTAERTVAAILHAWSEQRDAHVVVTGGRNGSAICKALDFELFRGTAEFRTAKNAKTPRPLHIWFSDERFVEFDDLDRTDTTLIENFKLTRNLITFHRVSPPSRESLLDAADSYSKQLKDNLGGQRFEVVILSLGEDGHVASCFPAIPDSLESESLAIAIWDSPKPPSERVSLSLKQLAQSNQIYVLAFGESKREAKDRSIDEGSALPVGLLRRSSPHGNIFVLTDLN